MKQAIFLAAALVAAQSAGAADWAIGVGGADLSEYNRSDDVALTAELHADPFNNFAGLDLSFAGGAAVHGDGDAWVGVGLSALAEFGTNWFAEGSVMPGYFDAANGRDDGGNFQIRSLIGVGYSFANGNRLSLGFDHKSNASTKSPNPGINTVSLRLRRSF